MAAHPLARRGVVLLEPALLPALVPDRWDDAGDVAGVRLVKAGGHTEGSRPILLAPAAELAGAARRLASEGAAALIFVGTCVSPTRMLEPGDVLVADRWRSAAGEGIANPAMANKLANRCLRRGLKVHRGVVASGGVRAASGDAAEDTETARVLAACAEADVPAGALLVCASVEARAGTEAPAAVLEAFDRLFGVVQEILGSARTPTVGSPSS